jgi:threonine/homoserine/homoserine lactone efflux protein
VVVVAVPGITVSTVIGTALARGLKPALWFEVGAALARLTMVLIVAIALEAVTGIVSAAFDIIKYAGAAYLLYIGIGYLTSKKGIDARVSTAPVSARRQVAAGFLTLWGNPKALLFFGAFIPQFVDPHYLAWPQVVILGLIEIVAAMFTDGAYIAISVGARRLLLGKAVVWVNRVAGVILIGAAVWLATLSKT